MKKRFCERRYKADLVLINPNAEITVSKENILSKCGWSPLENETFHSEITHTFVNGFLAYENGKVSPEKHGERLFLKDKIIPFSKNMNV